ncbi:hypothetical protein DPMN_005279 [Dreissena polymorpha]|uniref:Uncharacterized protein n=1 Tax=Dreissena polymorpha TaxID=45954 RepID=A0A9D4RU99_DREPO|nr:hypothetical protein DPMN_005279 [Dreissena polymorpha]
MHINSWTQTNPNTRRYIASNINVTMPFVDAPRYILIPCRVKHGTSNDHIFDPLPGFKG